jgi:hypothetical protein
LGEIYQQFLAELHDQPVVDEDNPFKHIECPAANDGGAVKLPGNKLPVKMKKVISPAVDPVFFAHFAVICCNQFLIGAYVESSGISITILA